ncbi:MAG: GNAT family N-acetyltransferase [Chthoniobacteraceae bacterium]
MDLPAPALVIRPAVAGDAEALDALIEGTRRWVQDRCPAQWQTPFSKEWVVGRIAAKELFVVFADDELVGTFRLLWSDADFWGELDSPDAAYLHTLIVRRDLAGNGLGIRILRWAESYVAAAGRSLLRLDTLFDNEHLIRFYQKAGFSILGERGVRDFRVVLFEKSLTPPLAPPQ